MQAAVLGELSPLKFHMLQFKPPGQIKKDFIFIYYIQFSIALLIMCVHVYHTYLEITC